MKRDNLEEEEEEEEEEEDSLEIKMKTIFKDDYFAYPKNQS